jgi:predicted ATP-grasp superfamily ATP-dependent carboligase
MNVLVIGNNTRNIACSAKRGGYTVYALDRFCDEDMQLCSDKSGLIGNSPDEGIAELSGSFGEFDAVVLGPGYERLKFRNILNNSPTVVEEVNDKLKIARKLASMDIPHPATESLPDVKSKVFPLMIKPRSGSGGILNIVVRDEEELEDLKSRKDASNYVAQEFIEGIPCSASLICTRDDAIVVALNEQLIGNRWLTRLPFAYCGNITPFLTEYRDDMIRYAEQIALEYGLVGSNGIDFILTEKGAVVIEINPRFQGSIDTVELSYGINIFDAHVKSFSGELPRTRDHVCYAGKAIFFANKELVINEQISRSLVKCMIMNRIADIPGAGNVIQPDEPVTTLIGTGETRRAILRKLFKYSNYIRKVTET